MSNTSSSKKIAIVVIVVIIIIVLWFVMKNPTTNQVSNTATDTTTTNTATSQQGASALGAMPTDPDVAAVKNSGDSDDSLNKDAASIDAQLKDFNSDTTNASANTTTK